MYDTSFEKSNEMAIDVQRLLNALWRKLWLIVSVSVLCTVLAFLLTFFLITPKYESASMFYVNNSDKSTTDMTYSIDSGDISASKSLVDSYIVILQTRESLDEVINYSGVNRTYAELKRMIAASSVNATEIFEVVVTSPDPNEAASIAKAIEFILPNRISSIIEGTSAKVVGSAVVAARPSFPSYPINLAIGFIIGFILSAAFVVVKEIFNVSIRTEEDLTRCSSLPVLSSVPDITAPSKGGYYDTRKKKKKKTSATNFSNEKQTALVGSNISFAASEAYKLLRTKLQFSFAADDKNCRIIGVSSALSGEGKSLTAVNLTYSLAELDKRVLLVDCDMRRPSLFNKLPIAKSPGLSNYLSGQSDLPSMIQNCTIDNSRSTFSVIAAGRNPPNPVELLSSARMQFMLQQLSEYYDYIILDFPPVGEVSDALAVAKLTDGILLVSRQNYCNRLVFSSTVRQFEFINARLLGIVYNCVNDNSTGYGKKYYYRKYYKYAGAYESAQHRTKRNTPKSTPAAPAKNVVNHEQTH